MHKDIMKYFLGKVIKINRGGPESRIGKLMDYGDDHLAIYTEDDGIVYYNMQQIKSFTDNMKGNMPFNVDVPSNLVFKKADHFQDLLEALKFQWVGINRGGPEKLEGVLSDIHKDYISIINKEEIVRISTYHIMNISYGVKIEEAQEGKSNYQASNQSNKSNKQVVNQSSKSESNKNKSSQRVAKSSNVIKEELIQEPQYDQYEEEATLHQTHDDEVSLTELLSSMERYLRNVTKTRND
ncbi:hypothetical protein ABES02_06020 [Neobacillus pocheonensis]|uniref:hypothetical protein n=1 Tax=Neobacillus pocheonensis TaxID=363869 RepID=UPI003D28E3E3